MMPETSQVCITIIRRMVLLTKLVVAEKPSKPDHLHFGSTGTLSPSPVEYSSREFSLDWITM